MNPVRATTVPLAILFVASLAGSISASSTTNRVADVPLPQAPPSFKECADAAYKDGEKGDKSLVLKEFYDCIERRGAQKESAEFIKQGREYAATQKQKASARMTVAEYTFAQDCVKLVGAMPIAPEEKYRLKLWCFDKTKLDGKKQRPLR